MSAEGRVGREGGKLGNPNRNTIEKVFTLRRGDRVDTEEAFGDLKRLLDEGSIKEMIDLIRDTTLVRDFGGIFYSVRFRTDRPIVLTSLGFWGPASDRACDCGVKIVFTQYFGAQPAYGQDTIAVGELTGRVTAEPKAIFEIPLRDRIFVKAWTWTRIQFQLNGMFTYACASVRDSYFCQDSNVNFKFNSSSHQLPLIKYILAS